MTKGRFQYLSMAPCLLAIIIDGMGFGLVYPIMTAIFTSQDSALSYHLSSTMQHFYLGLGYMLYPLCMFFGASFMGDLSDNIGRKKVLLMCMVGILASFLLMAAGIIYSSIFLLMLGRALSGLMAGSQPIAQAAIADISTPETKAFNMSIMTLALSFANVAGPLIGGVFSDHQLVSFFNFATPFFIVAILTIVAIIWIIMGFHETFSERVAKPINFFRPVTIFIEAFEHKSVRILAIVFLFMQLGFSIYFQFILVLLKNTYHYQNWQLGAFSGFIGFCFALSLLLGLKIMLRFWKINTVAVISLLIVGLGLIVTTFVTSQELIWLLAVPISFFDMIAYTALLTAFSNAVEKNAQGWVMGVSGAIMALSWAMTGLSANALPLLGVEGLIFIGGVFLLIGGLLMWFFIYATRTWAVAYKN